MPDVPTESKRAATVRFHSRHEAARGQADEYPEAPHLEQRDEGNAILPTDSVIDCEGAMITQKSLCGLFAYPRSKSWHKPASLPGLHDQVNLEQEQGYRFQQGRE